MESIFICPTTQVLKFFNLSLLINPSFPLAGDVQSGVHSCVPGGGWVNGGQAGLEPHLADPAAGFEAVPGRVAHLAPRPVHQLLLPPHKIQARSQTFFFY